MKIPVISAVVMGGLFLLTKDDSTPAQPKPMESPLLGHWVGIVTDGYPGPAQITTITINEDGTYHRLVIEISPGKTYKEEDPASYVPDGAELQHSTGWIDLKTGEERITDADRRLSVKSVTWTVQDGILHWDMDMGGMGGQGMTYSPGQ